MTEGGIYTRLACSGDVGAPATRRTIHEDNGLLLRPARAGGADSPPGRRAGARGASRLEAAREVDAARLPGDARGHHAVVDPDDGRAGRAGPQSSRRPVVQAPRVED